MHPWHFSLLEECIVSWILLLWLKGNKVRPNKNGKKTCLVIFSLAAFSDVPWVKLRDVSHSSVQPEIFWRLIQIQMEQTEALTSQRDLNSLCSMRRSSLNSRVTMVACRGVLSRIDSPKAVPVPSVHIVTASCIKQRWCSTWGLDNISIYHYLDERPYILLPFGCRYIVIWPKCFLLLI